MFVIRGEGPFADAVRRTLEYAQNRGIDLSGVEVEVVPDPSITDFGAYTEHRGGLKFRIRYNPRYAGDPMLAAHEAGHVAYWSWAIKTDKTRFFNNPDVIEPLAEAFGAVVARQLYNWPVAFKGAPPNLTKILPERFTYITTTADGRPMVVKVPEWDDYMKRYRAGILLSPYFYNMTNWAHVFGNFTAAPADVIKTVHKAWQSGAVEVVPGWGAVWRREPTWNWLDSSADKTLDNTSGQQKPNETSPTDVSSVTPLTGGVVTQKNDASENNTSPQVGPQRAVVQAQPSTDVPLPPSDVQPPRYFSSDVTPTHAPSEWNKYISGRRVLVVFRNWPSLDTATMKETRKDHVAGVGVVSGGSLRFERKIPAPRVVDPNAWIEVVDEKTGKVLARLRSDELYKLTNEGAPVTLYWSHVAAEEKWPEWERFIDRAKELEEKLGTWRSSSAAVPPPAARGVTDIISPDGTVSVVGVANAPTEYVPPKVPGEVLKQFESLLSELKKLGEGVNLRNIEESHDKFILLRDMALNIVHTYPQLVDEANKTIEKAGSKIREVSDRLYDALAKAAGRDSFWRGDGDVKVPIGVYKYDPATGAFLLSLYDRPTVENVVGYIKDDGTPVVVKKTQNMSEALEEHNKLLKRQPPERTNAKQIVVQQSGKGQQTPDFLRPLRGVDDFLANVFKTGAGVVFTALGGARPSNGSDLSGGQQFVVTTPQSAPRNRVVYNRRRGLPTSDDSPVSSLEFTQPPNRQQRQDEFAVDRPSRPLDIILAEGNGKRNATRLSISQPTSGGSSGSGSEFVQPSGGGSDASRAPSLLGIVLGPAVQHALAQAASSAENRQSSGHVSAPSIASPPDVQTAETSQTQSSSEPRRRLGRPVAVAI